MAAVEVGKICVKIAGREAGRRCVIVDIIDKNFVLITGPQKITGLKRRRVNVNHIVPTKSKININRGADDEDVIQAIESEGKTEEMATIVKPGMSQLF